MRKLENLFLVLDWGVQYDTEPNPEFDDKAVKGPKADPQVLVKTTFIRQARIETDEKRIKRELNVIPNLDVAKIVFSEPGGDITLERLSTAVTNVIVNNS